jgi:hypothetical protein
MESRRLSSSGGKYSDVRSRTSDLAFGFMMPVSESHAEGCARISLPRLLVKQMMVFCLGCRKIKKTGKRGSFTYFEIYFATLTVRDSTFVKNLK